MQVTHDLGVGGLPRVVVTLSRTLDRSEFEVSVLALNETGPLADELNDADVDVHLLGDNDERPGYLAFRDAARLFEQEGVDVVHTHNTQPFIDGGLGAWSAGVETLIHTDHARDFPDKRRYMLAEWALSHLTYRVVGVSDDTSRKLTQYERIDPERIVTIPNGIEDAPFQRPLDRRAKLDELGVEPEDRLIGVGVRFTEQKGLGYLLEALPEVLDRVPRTKLLMAGYGPLEEQLRERARDLAVTEDVRFLGKRLDMPDLMRLFDVYALPSIWEGLPLVVLEAMAAGCPVVASSVGGVPTAVEHERTGLLVEPRRPDELADALVRVLGDERRREEMSRENRRVFEEKFNADAMTRAYESLYRRSL